jgi:hypothetical protein
LYCNNSDPDKEEVPQNYTYNTDITQNKIKTVGSDKKKEEKQPITYKLKKPIRNENEESTVNDKSIGPSEVRALPLAAGINEGGHYFRYCQAQPNPQLSSTGLSYP